MSEAAAAVPKKKGKLPVIIVLVAMLAGGGFFGMKMKGGGAKEKPKVVLGEKMVEMEELLVNLDDQTTWLRTKIALHMEKGFKEEKMKDLMPAIEDAVIAVLKSKSPADVASVAKLPALKHELAAQINEVLKSVEPAEGEKKDEGKEPEKGAKPEKTEKPAKPEHPDWDSQTGPVLKVYFRSFAVQ